MSFIDALILGLVQGLTEFLPVSSSGHLVLAGRLLGLQHASLAFDVWLHLATLTAVLVALRSDVWTMLRSLSPSAAAPVAKRGRTLIVAVVVGTIPAVIVGLLAKDAVEAAFTSVRLVGVDLLLTAVILGISRMFPGRGMPLGPMKALGIGVAQCIAILPGVSRSGSTLTAGLMFGLSGEEAARFSFLLSVPAILGAAVLDAKEIAHLGGQPLLLIGSFVVAAVSGYVAIRVVWKVMERGKLAMFAPYCALLGIAALLIGGVVPQ